MRIRDWAGVEAFWADNGGETPAERKLIEACKAGQWCRLEDGKLPSAKPINPGRHIRADVLRYVIIGGCESFKVDELGVQLQGAQITGSLDLSVRKTNGATFLHNCRFSHAIDATGAKFKHLSINGSAMPELMLGGARIRGQFNAVDVRLSNPGGTTLEMQGAQVGEDVVLSGRFRAKGMVGLANMKIGGQLQCMGSRLSNFSGTAINLQGTEIYGGSHFGNDFIALGLANLSGINVGGQLSFLGARFSNPSQTALNLQGAMIGHDLFFGEKFRAKGMVDLNSAKIGGGLNLVGSWISNANGKAINLQNAQVRGKFIFRSLTVINGKIDMKDAHVHTLVDDLECWQKCNNFSLDGFTYNRFSGSDTSTGSRHRLEWIRNSERMDGIFFPQPYSQLSKVLAEMGHTSDARKVRFSLAKQLAQENQKRAFAEMCAKVERPRLGAAIGNTEYKILRKAWLFCLGLADWMSRNVVGYGLYPFFSVIWLLGLFAVGWLLASQAWQAGDMAPNSAVILNSPQWIAIERTQAKPGNFWSQENCTVTLPQDPGPQTCTGKDWESFSSIAYALDVVVPIIDLGQTAAWAPSTNRGGWGSTLWWARWVLSIAGWIVTALGAAAITGVIRRE